MIKAILTDFDNTLFDTRQVKPNWKVNLTGKQYSQGFLSVPYTKGGRKPSPT